MVSDAALGLPKRIDACLFDLDGVLTDTASVHRKAWKAMFDEYLKSRAERTGDRFVAFDTDSDYQNYVDGKKREDGVRSFLDSRDITLPDGDPDDDPSAETVYGLGNRKNELFLHTLHEDGIEVFEGSRRYLDAVAAAGPRRGGGLVERQHSRGARRHRPRPLCPSPRRRRDHAGQKHRR